MSKPLKLTKQTVELRPSRIRRDPVRVESVARKAPRRSREQEIWLAIAGIALFAMAIGMATLGISAITGNDNTNSAVAATPPRFGDCEDAADCVIDGETIRIDGRRVKIAGMEAPRIRFSRCAEEEGAGVKAVGKLHELLNSGKVTIAGEVRQGDGELRTTVLVDGKDVGAAMIGAGVARVPGNAQGSWC